MKRLNLDGPINDKQRGAPRKHRQELTYAAYGRRVDWWSNRLGVDKIKSELGNAYDMVDQLQKEGKLRAELQAQHGNDDVDALQDELIKNIFKVDKLTNLWHEA